MSWPRWRPRLAGVRLAWSGYRVCLILGYRSIMLGRRLGLSQQDAGPRRRGKRCWLHRARIEGRTVVVWAALRGLT